MDPRMEPEHREHPLASDQHPGVEPTGAALRPWMEEPVTPVELELSDHDRRRHFLAIYVFGAAIAVAFVLSVVVTSLVLIR